MIPRSLVLTASALLIATSSACAQQGGAPAADHVARHSASFPADSLVSFIRAREAETGATIGFHLRHVQSGRTVGHNAADPFFMSSVTKFPISLTVLRQVERGRVRLDDTVTIAASQLSPGRSPLRQAHPNGARLAVRDLIPFAVSQSDNTASDALLRLAGGPDSVTAELRRLGLAGIRVSRPYTQLGRELGGRWPAGDDRDTMTPETATALLAALQQGRALAAPQRALLLGWMTRTQNPASRIVAGVPAGTVVAHKTGTWWGDDQPGPLALNDIGIVSLPNGEGHLAIAVFVRNAAVADTAVERAVAAITREAWRLWTARRASTAAFANDGIPATFARLERVGGSRVGESRGDERRRGRGSDRG
ncbi:MAG TPA: class A beta-lactamase [Longimicrobium sp.]|nr:class A beta-lactamase [Longimicrobium sp.]